MTSRERIRTIIAGGTPDRVGLWLGMPHPDTWEIYKQYFDCADQQEIRDRLGDDFAWFVAEGWYKHPEGKSLFAFTRSDGGEGPVFADCTDVSDLDRHEWPNPDYLDFAQAKDALCTSGDRYRLGGMWSPFFHVVAALFGMENYFVKMHTDPDVVDAVTRRVCEFYLEANERFFSVVGDELDAFFFGNDFGTQLDLIISPGMFDRFILPDIRRLVQLAHKHDRQVIMHSCGAIHKIIDRLIDCGVQALHPLQAKANDMSAEVLARDFAGRISFMGGIDTQDLLVNGTPDDVRADVQLVKALLGPRLIVSPSHEAVLPNVPPENVEAMALAAKEFNRFNKKV